ncbi:amino acid adenylation domain-containing protein [Vibrio cholerae]|nr:amino acid adenylation domain-containing protein [Vibrio cholerae]EGR4346407.1 amino acid adenylation domain-containing protein [Vibrio cholerae]EHZ7430740.1 amino acid adenylation domain-containing protein [Vibrio cholerae]EJL6364541.1 amino acid adenylation domain-containing protein [Vibrio cholerae]EKF9397948.1 amino acid adenylation domain-containing protein [Vibrio cholerae]EKF9445010.1 amino acid adenylation domain-containing protein [Vibrio cholerae]
MKKNPRDLLSMFIEQAVANPNRTVVKKNEFGYTYKDIALGAWLVSDLVNHSLENAGQYIGIYTDQDESMYYGIFGALFSNMGYIPLSPEYPDDRIEYMLSNSGVKVIFTKQKYADKLRDFVHNDAHIITLEQLAFSSSEDFDFEYITQIQRCESSPAYMIYTSGSTGKPKGVAINNRNITNQMQWVSEELNFDQCKTILQKTPMSFDAAQWEILAICCGTTVVLGDADLYKNPTKIIAEIKKHNITSIQCVPTLLKALLTYREISSCDSLIEVFCGGEALTKKLALEFKKHLRTRRLVNLYGPTECTINASFLDVDLNCLEDYPDVIPIGIPVKNTEIFILNDFGEPVMDNEVGEICISGPQLSPGYYNNELATADKFIFTQKLYGKSEQLIYKTGDLGYYGENGHINFVSRKDNQVKVRGYRIELDEVKVAIESHDWVKYAGVIVAENARTENKEILAYVELNPREAALMDQGLDQSHHVSKNSKKQVKAQLSNLGVRAFSASTLRVKLPGKSETKSQSCKAFARKTYRSFKGDKLNLNDLITLVSHKDHTQSNSKFNGTVEELGSIMRMFGQFHSKERLLPKYSYASPGALYAVQIYVELAGISGIADGIYYYTPTDHTFVQVDTTTGHNQIKVHLVGIHSAISCVYQNNVVEVLEMEAGHIIGMFDDVLNNYGLHASTLYRSNALANGVMNNSGSLYLTSFDIIAGQHSMTDSPVETYIQANNSKIAQLTSGTYLCTNGDIAFICEKSIRKKDVIAINQSVYSESHFGVSLVVPEENRWDAYIWLGRELQRLQLNELGIGLMSSGYSSKTGHDLPSCSRMKDILSHKNKSVGAFYFAIGGPVTKEQIRSQGMKEDLIHSRGPTEILRDDLKRTLPIHMIPNKITVLHKMPQTSNGKVDNNQLKQLAHQEEKNNIAVVIQPENDIQKNLARIWSSILEYSNVSIDDEFFASGGDSLSGVMLISEINQTMNVSLPLQVLFDRCSIKKLEQHIVSESEITKQRVLQLNNRKGDKNIFCWPGLGGYPMGLKNLAESVSDNFYGIQAYGINENELPYSTIEEMAAEDVKAIKSVQNTGPYYLWGYSFGARVAFETAYQLEQQGDVVKQLALIAPGSPKLNIQPQVNEVACYTNQKYVTILYSVFFRKISGSDLEQCLLQVNSKDSFINFVKSRLPEIDTGTIERIVSIVEETYDFKYTFKELEKRIIKAEISILKSIGDDYSFVDSNHRYYSITPSVFNLTYDHYQSLSVGGSREISEILCEPSIIQYAQ